MKVLLADDHALFRDGLRLQIESMSSETTFAEVSNYKDLIELSRKNAAFDLALLDLDMPTMDWFEGLSKFCENFDKSKIIIISASENHKNINKVLEFGVAGYIPKRSATKVLLSAINLVLDGGKYIPPTILCGVDRTHSSDNYHISDEKLEDARLTKRQKQVLYFLGEGLANKQIAYKMQLSEATIKLHINALLKNLGVNNRTQAVLIAQKNGLL
ncbi:MAG: response regulator [Alphaproteobacteria bacterium]